MPAQQSSFSIPSVKRAPQTSLDGTMIWIYGPPKIGKTTLAASFPGVWFVATEKGQNFLSSYEPQLVSSWGEFLEWCAFVAEAQPRAFGDGQPIRFLCIDTITNLYKFCYSDVCAGLGVDDPGELSHGKGWSRITNEWERVMNKVRAWPFGLIAISHAKQHEFKTKTRKVDRWEPDIGAAGYRWCQSQSDLILYAQSTEVAQLDSVGNPTGVILEQRELVCHPQAAVVAGARFAKKLPPTIPLDEENGYARISSYLSAPQES